MDGGCLIKETKAHIIILFLFGFLFLLGSSRGSSSSSWGGSCSRSSSSSWHGAQLVLASFNQLLNVLASQLLDNHVDFFIVSVNSNRAKNFLDVGSGWFSSSEGSEQSSSNVTHV